MPEMSMKIRMNQNEWEDNSFGWLFFWRVDTIEKKNNWVLPKKAYITGIICFDIDRNKLWGKTS